jgi:hypothetical protein
MNCPVQPSQFEGIRPGRVWSLWDMAANFSFAEMHRLLQELGILITTSHHNMEQLAKFGASRSSGALGQAIFSSPEQIEALNQANELVRYVIDLTTKLLAALKSHHINDAAVRLRYWLKSNPQEWSELNTRARALRDCIQTELKTHLYYQYPREKAQKMRAYKIDWHKSLAAFPVIDGEVFSAVDTYAMEQNTASVFHSMRVAEHGLRAIAGERRIKLPRNRSVEWATWQEIIKALDTEIVQIGNKKPGKARDTALSFYSGARADLNGFKDEYRNLVMHVRATYDEHQALRALTQVHDFMQRLAAKLDHTHKRIRWGKF